MALASNSPPTRHTYARQASGVSYSHIADKVLGALSSSCRPNRSNHGDHQHGTFTLLGIRRQLAPTWRALRGHRNKIIRRPRATPMALMEALWVQLSGRETPRDHKWPAGIHCSSADEEVVPVLSGPLVAWGQNKRRVR